MNSIQLPYKPKCPKCDHALDGQAHPTGRTPEPGDISVCAYCSSVNVFTDQQTLETLSEDQLAEKLKDQPALKDAIEGAIKFTKRMREKRQTRFN